MFAIEVTLLTGRYVATAFDRRSRAEWPPHPARLYSALVDAHYDGGSTDEREALQWLERLGAPRISASEASQRDIATVFVPVNDPSVIGSFDDEAKALADLRIEVAAARDVGGKTLTSLEKKLAKVEAKFQENISKAIAVVPAGKEGKEGPSRAASLLPDRRERQPRTFPSVSPTDPRIVFSWPHATPTNAQNSTLDALAARVVRLGHSSSLVSVRAGEIEATSTWIPDETGEVVAKQDELTVRTVSPGQLDALQETFERAGAEPGRVMPASFQRYIRPSSRRSERAPTTVFDQLDWIVLRRAATVSPTGGRNIKLPSTRAAEVARVVRAALLAGYGANAPEVLSGHRSPNAPTDRPHVAFVPLPFVGHERADGSILGVAIILPAQATSADRSAVYSAIRNWKKNAATEYKGELPVLLGRGGVFRMELVEEEAEQQTLHAATWCARSRFWSSATPVALDRNPGDLRSSDPAKEAAAYAAAEATIATACEHIGLPRPVRVIATPSAPLAGGDKARAFPSYAPGQPPVQRVLVHARLEFDRAVEGPILLGAGRYRGLGLFRPVRDHG